MENKIPLTPISNFGEFALIKHLTQNVKLTNKSSIKGIGDDAAVLYAGNEKHSLVSSDLLVEGVHFDLSYVPLKHLGYKAVIVNISDICAMNAVPTQIIVSIAVSNRFSVEALNELYEGILLACKNYNLDLVGGDTTSSLTGLTISITAIGEAKKDDIVYRNQAKENNIICVSGDLGASYAGLQLLEREKEVFKSNPNVQPDFEQYSYILERQLKPEARLDFIRLFKQEKILPTAMIDISDGLSSELLHICEQSQSGCLIFEEKIPIDPETISLAKELNIDPTICAMNGGEDYELLFTLPLNDYEKVKNISGIYIIGHITEQSQGAKLVAKDGTLLPLQAQGWNPFKE